MPLPATSEVKSFTEVYWNGLFILYYTGVTKQNNRKERKF
jgi:hypothetical protein